MKVTSNWRESYVGIGISQHANRVRFVTGTPQQGEGVAHMSVADAVELRKALTRAIREVRRQRVVPPPAKVVT
jgi:hypothetical protein